MHTAHLRGLGSSAGRGRVLHVRVLMRMLVCVLVLGCVLERLVMRRRRRGYEAAAGGMGHEWIYSGMVMAMVFGNFE